MYVSWSSNEHRPCCIRGDAERGYSVARYPNRNVCNFMKRVLKRIQPCECPSQKERESESRPSISMYLGEGYFMNL